MNNFDENSIKRGMTHENFLTILKEKVEIKKDDENFGGYTYGQVSSWLVWKRDQNGNLIQDIDGPEGRLNWEEDQHLPNEYRFTEKLTTDIIFICLNMAGTGRPGWPENTPFQNARGVKKLYYTFFDTKAEGGYFTDIVKPDERVLEHLESIKKSPSDSTAITEFFINKKNHHILKEHIYLFKKELEFIRKDRKNPLIPAPLLIIFGDNVYKILKTIGIDEYNILEKDKDYSKIIKIPHYSNICAHYNDIRVYKNKCGERLNNIITIPTVEITQVQKQPKISPADIINNEIKEIKTFFQNNDIEMEGPFIKEIGNKKKTIMEYYINTRLDLFEINFSIFPENANFGKEKTYVFRYYDNNPDGVKLLTEKYELIKNIFPNSEPILPEHKKWAGMMFYLNNPKEEVLDIIQKTRDFLGF